jgi:hypothetical protein
MTNAPLGAVPAPITVSTATLRLRLAMLICSGHSERPGETLDNRPSYHRLSGTVFDLDQARLGSGDSHGCRMNPTDIATTLSDARLGVKRTYHSLPRVRRRRGALAVRHLREAPPSSPEDMAHLSGPPCAGQARDHRQSMCYPRRRLRSTMQARAVSAHSRSQKTAQSCVGRQCGAFPETPIFRAFSALFRVNGPGSRPGRCRLPDGAG